MRKNPSKLNSLAFGVVNDKSYELLKVAIYESLLSTGAHDSKSVIRVFQQIESMAEDFSKTPNEEAVSLKTKPAKNPSVSTESESGIDPDLQV